MGSNREKPATIVIIFFLLFTSTPFTTLAFAQPSTGITGIKFNDLNQNGVQDGLELGLANWEICAQDLTLNIFCVLTDGNGNYFISQLNAPETYFVFETFQNGFIQTLPPIAFPDEGIYVIDLPRNTVIFDVDFGNVAFTLGEIHGTRFIDTDGDGIKDPGEPGRPGLTMELHSGTDVPITTTTDNNGDYWFTGLDFGLYRVFEVPVAGDQQTLPGLADFSFLYPLVFAPLSETLSAQSNSLSLSSESTDITPFDVGTTVTPRSDTSTKSTDITDKKNSRFWNTDITSAKIPKNVKKSNSEPLIQNSAELFTPLLTCIPDTVGDSTSDTLGFTHDLTEICLEYDAVTGDLIIELRFNEPISPFSDFNQQTSVVGFLDIDADNDVLTGINFFAGGDPNGFADIGAEFTIDLAARGIGPPPFFLPTVVE